MTSGAPPVGGGNGGAGTGGQPPLIAYSRVPGNKQRYYDPANPADVITAYRYGKYRKSLTPDQKQFLDNIGSELRSRAGIERTRLANSYIVKQASEGVFLTRGQVRNSSEFKDLVYRLRIGRYNMRTFEQRRDTVAGRLGYRAITDPEGPLAKVLVALGYRLPTDDFAVGLSPKGHSATVQNFLRMEAYAEGWSGAA